MHLQMNINRHWMNESFWTNECLWKPSPISIFRNIRLAKDTKRQMYYRAIFLHTKDTPCQSNLPLHLCPLFQAAIVLHLPCVYLVSVIPNAEWLDNISFATQADPSLLLVCWVGEFNKLLHFERRLRSQFRRQSKSLFRPSFRYKNSVL